MFLICKKVKNNNMITAKNIYLKKIVYLSIYLSIYLSLFICIYLGLFTAIYQSNRAIGQRVFANGLGDWDSIPGRVIPKTIKMVLDAALLSTQHYKMRTKGKLE